MSKRIVHLSSVHPANDTRIFIKECMSLADAGYKVTLVARPPRTEFDSGPVNVIELDFPGGRAGRIILGSFKMLRTAMSLPADVYHFHDPELILVGLILKALGKRVTYDVHEDVPAQIMNKEWIPRSLRRAVAFGVSIAHRVANSVLDGIIVARADAAQAFHGDNVVLVQNYPLLSEFAGARDRKISPSTGPYKIAYVGGISSTRGIREMIAAVDLLSEKYNVTLELAGPMPPSLMAACKQMPGWERVRYYKWVDRKQMSRILADSVAALLIFHPIPNHLTSYPNKLFEYMSAGVPIVASDFEYWHQYVSEVGSGILVDPMDPKAIADAVQAIIDDPATAHRMGENGLAAVRDRWNWGTEADKLVVFFNALMGKS